MIKSALEFYAGFSGHLLALPLIFRSNGSMGNAILQV